jgi:hypothetical protein
VYPLPVDSLYVDIVMIWVGCMLSDVCRQGAQFYVNCAQIRVVNENEEVGTLGPAVKIPGVYTFGQKGEC